MLSDRFRVVDLINWDIAADPMSRGRKSCSGYRDWADHEKLPQPGPLFGTNFYREKDTPTPPNNERCLDPFDFGQGKAFAPDDNFAFLILSDRCGQTPPPNPLRQTLPNHDWGDKRAYTIPSRNIWYLPASNSCVSR
jgi:hypothetical protein